MSVVSPLVLLAAPSGSSLLSGLAGGPRSLDSLRGDLGMPPATTTRGHLRPLVSAGAVEKRRHGGFPGSVDYRLTPSGVDLWEVGAVLAAWLAVRPHGPVPLGSHAAKRATRALSEGWRSGLVHAFASSSLSLTELAGSIADLSYPAVERRFTAMRRLGLVEPVAGRGQSKPFGPSLWLRQGLLPLLASWRWLSRWRPEAAALSVEDAEAALLLALPNGYFADAAAGPGFVVAGTPAAWAAALLDGDRSAFDLSGDAALGADLLERMRQDLAPQ